MRKPQGACKLAVDEVAASMGADGDEMPGVIDIASLQRRLIVGGTPFWVQYPTSLSQSSRNRIRGLSRCLLV